MGHQRAAERPKAAESARVPLIFEFQIRQVDVYVNGKHVLRKRGLHLNKVTVKSLPKKGRYSVKIILTTKLGYHLISRRTYKAC